MENLHNFIVVSYQKALDVQEKSLSPSHPEFATTYTNIGAAQQVLTNYAIAPTFYKKAHAIKKMALPATHPAIGTTYNNIGHVHQLRGEYAIANDYYHIRH